MLKSLSIRNYALIEAVEIAFEPGLNILTGETGAGKSIIVDALSLVLGERASADEIRKGSEKAVVEGIFAVSTQQEVQRLLKESGLDSSDELIVRREVSVKGTSRCFVNDSPVSLAVLKSFGEALVDLHGQHEHQSLLRPSTHIGLVDDFGGLAGMVTEFRSSFRRLEELFEEFEALRARERQLKEKRDLYDFQIREIDAVDPAEGEETRLEEELRILENSEKLFEATSQLHQSLYEGEAAVYDALVKARNQLQDLADIDRTFEEAKNDCTSAAALVGEITKFVQRYNSKIEFDPERLEEIRNRLGAFSLLKKKYGGSVEAVVAHRAAIGREFAIAENFEAEIVRMEAAIEAERRVCSTAAERLSAKRRELAPRINRSVTAELAKLGIPNGRFDVRIANEAVTETGKGHDRVYVRLGRDPFRATPTGIDVVEFYLTANAGEDPKPLARTASGGEISRIMLALKTVLAKSERLPLLVFDEIDVGISGRIGQAVGKSLNNLAQFHQIIAITHLPQIAGLADTHFVVEKSEQKNRAATTIRRLELEERVQEVAKLMSGAEVTAAGLKGARELMGMK